MSEKWVPFYLDTNSVWGLVENREQWLEMKSQWARWQNGRDGEELKDCPGLDDAQQSLRKLPKFGFVCECVGPGTLGMFFEQNGMEW